MITMCTLTFTKQVQNKRKCFTDCSKRKCFTDCSKHKHIHTLCSNSLCMQTSPWLKLESHTNTTASPDITALVCETVKSNQQSMRDLLTNTRNLEYLVYSNQSKMKALHQRKKLCLWKHSCIKKAKPCRHLVEQVLGVVNGAVAPSTAGTASAPSLLAEQAPSPSGARKGAEQAPQPAVISADQSTGDLPMDGILQWPPDGTAAQFVQVA